MSNKEAAKEEYESYIPTGCPKQTFEEHRQDGLCSAIFTAIDLNRPVRCNCSQAGGRE